MFGRYLLTCAVIALSVGCTRANPDFCDSETVCGEGLRCELDNNRCVAGVCEPGEGLECVGDSMSMTVCSADGTAFEMVECEFGCNADRVACNECAVDQVVCDGTGDTGELTVCGADGTLVDQRDCLLGCKTEGPACVDIAPSNGLATDLDLLDAEATTSIDLLLEDDFVVDSDQREIRDGGGNKVLMINQRDQPQGGEKTIVVFRVRSLEIIGRVLFTGTLPVAFVSDRDIVIDARLDVESGRLDDAALACNAGAPVPSGGSRSGGGGGAYTNNGAAGGSVLGASGGAGGGGNRGVESLEPLLGGCPGGQSVGPNPGGFGGGALQLVSRQVIELTENAELAAVGVGGGFDLSSGAASGGGSGGAVLLEAPRISLTTGAFVSANGGCGGCATAAGDNGRLNETPAPGANCSNGDGSGGAGAALDDQNAVVGGAAMGSNVSGGGGGGGFGRIRTNNKSGALGAAGLFSPFPTVSSIGRR